MKTSFTSFVKMHMKRQTNSLLLSWGRSFIVLLALGTANADTLLAQETRSARAAWQAGDIDSAARLASQGGANDSRHILMLCQFVKGQYESALETYESIDPSYANYDELNKVVLNAWLHLGKVETALAFATTHNLDDSTRTILTKRLAKPLKVTLPAPIVIDFVAVPTGQIDLTDFFPGFLAIINGQRVRAHVDTGGTYLHMGLERAKELGIELFEAGTGYHGNREVKKFFGIAEHFQMGQMKMENVPVVALPSLTGGQDFIIFGTNILDRFLTTFDYPNKRLLLSLRADAIQRQKHLDLLHGESTAIPFHVWGDHYMLVHGSVGDHRANFFVDSGLVRIVPQPEGDGLGQVGLWATPKALEQWGLSTAGVFRSNARIGLGMNTQKGLLVEAKEKVPGSDLGGIRIDALLSHAYLRNYSWTIDFENREFQFR